MKTRFFITKTSIIKVFALVAIAVAANFSACKKKEDPATPAPIPSPVTKEPTQPPTFTLVETARTGLTGLTNPSTAVYEGRTGIGYFSNQGPGGREGVQNEIPPYNFLGKGFISKVVLQPDGRPQLEVKWLEEKAPGEGFNSPKGMAIYGNKLYVTDIDEIIEIDTQSKQTRRHPVVVAGVKAEFLNDIVVDDRNGNIYASNTWSLAEAGVSDRLDRVIYQLTPNGEITEWLRDNELNAPNGLYIDGGYMYVGSWGNGLDIRTFLSSAPGKILRINMGTSKENRKVEVVVDNVGNIDGIARTPDNDGFLVTDYVKGQLLYIDDATKTVKTVIPDLGIGAGDFVITYSSFLNSNVIVIPKSRGTEALTYIISK